MKEFFLIVLLVLGAILIATVGGGVLVLLAYGLAWLLNFILHFDLFQTTLLSLVAITITAIFIWRIIFHFLQPPIFPLNSDDDFEDDEDEDYESEDDIDDDQYSAIPRWRRPLKQIDFSNARPDDLCPCGSGRKYKNCHGRKPKK
jgi:hypothetical protein